MLSELQYALLKHDQKPKNHKCVSERYFWTALSLDLTRFIKNALSANMEFRIVICFMEIKSLKKNLLIKR